jgi:hypothetical protein
MKWTDIKKERTGYQPRLTTVKNPTGHSGYTRTQNSGHRYLPSLRTLESSFTRGFRPGTSHPQYPPAS